MKSLGSGLRQWFQSGVYSTTWGILAVLRFAGHLGMGSDGQQEPQSYTLSGTVDTATGSITMCIGESPMRHLRL
jgi:hypothetical protein